jgi:4-aminobutyrate aminotransferase / (S)-3-amino-2-methylpropionate transaminase / 5-aminovalerate transaminase
MGGVTSSGIEEATPRWPDGSDGGTESELRQLRDRYVARAVAVQKLFVRAGLGARLIGVDGREYIDFAGGIGSVNLGHRPPQVVKAIKEQADALLHSNFLVAGYAPYLDVCRLVCECAPGPSAKKAVLVNSGAEAVENAVKIARYATERPAVVAFDRAFHGRTLLGLSLTSKLVYKRKMGPFAPEVYRAPAPYPYRGLASDACLEALENLFEATVDPASVACVVLEPVQGEGGFLVMPFEFIRGVKRLCEQHGIVYIDDEVQAGMGRTGRLWAIEHADVVPDLLVFGKSIASGLPLAGVVGTAELVDAVHPGGLGSTFGGNPVACVAASETLRSIADPSFLARARDVGELITARLRALEDRHPSIGEVRGLGPMAAVELVKDPATREPDGELAGAVVQAALERGLVLLSTGIYGNVLRILVPLSASDDDLELGLRRLDEAFAAAEAQRER